MRVSPKAVFLGLVALGLPLSVTTGWILGDPATPAVSTPAGAGGLGTAPAAVAPSPRIAVDDVRAPASEQFAEEPVGVQPYPAPRTSAPDRPRPSVRASHSAKPTPSEKPSTAPTVVSASPAPSSTPDTGRTPRIPDPHVP